ncbi:MAG: hypothetical protein AB7H66_08625 [Hyphomonadaceae bacterium]
MLSTAIQWRLDAITHTDRLIAVAMEQLNDVNESRWLVHRVLLRAMTDMIGPATRGDLDTALGCALRDYPANAP